MDQKASRMAGMCFGPTKLPLDSRNLSLMSEFKIKEARKRLGLRINELSKILDVSRRSVERWESGERPTPGSVRLALELMWEKSQRESIDE